jgi:hypothetical protein
MGILLGVQRWWAIVTQAMPSVRILESRPARQPGSPPCSTTTAGRKIDSGPKIDRIIVDKSFYINHL